jgi:predicted RNA polymerase sigma factor
VRGPGLYCLGVSSVGVTHGPPAGLGLLQTPDSDARMAGHHRRDAVRGHLLEMAGEHAAAVESYRAAAARTASLPERVYLNRQAARLGGRP